MLIPSLRHLSMGAVRRLQIGGFNISPKRGTRYTPTRNLLGPPMAAYQGTPSLRLRRLQNRVLTESFSYQLC